MADLFRVAVHYGNDNSYIEYDSVSKRLNVALTDDAKRRETEDFLSRSHVMGIPQSGIHDFKQETIDPLKDIESFKLVLTRLWENTGVHVDWSRPV
jgi:hypothetical protein